MKLSRNLIAAGSAIAFATPAFAQQMKTCDGPEDACRQLVDAANTYNAAFAKNDAGALAALFTSDGVVVAEGPILSGREAIAKFYGDLWANLHPSSHSTTYDQTHIKGDNAWAVGTWTVKAPGQNDTPFAITGNWGAAYVRDGSTWKIRWNVWNVNHPPP